MIKKVAVINGVIIHIYHDETELETLVFEDATIEEREMFYTSENGWREVGFIVPPTSEERIEQLENMLIMMMEVM